MRELYQEGATIAGTSSGASVMTEVMMAAQGTLTLPTRWAALCGWLRGWAWLPVSSSTSISRSAAASEDYWELLRQYPRLLGIGIDEDTAFVLDGHEQCSVVGGGAVYIIDGREVTYSNVAQDEKQTMSAFGMRVHVLSSGDKFNLTTRVPMEGKNENVEQPLAK